MRNTLFTPNSQSSSVAFLRPVASASPVYVPELTRFHANKIAVVITGSANARTKRLLAIAAAATPVHAERSVSFVHVPSDSMRPPYLCGRAAAIAQSAISGHASASLLGRNA